MRLEAQCASQFPPPRGSVSPQPQRARRHRSSWLGRALRFSVVSGFNVLAGQGLLWVGFVLLGLAPVVANGLSVLVVGGPSYLLCRRWVWGCDGATRQVVYFWALTVLGFAVSTVAVAWVGAAAPSLVVGRSAQGILLDGAAFGSYGLLWALRFLVLDRVVFVREVPAVVGTRCLQLESEQVACR